MFAFGVLVFIVIYAGMYFEWFFTKENWLVLFYYAGWITVMVFLHERAMLSITLYSLRTGAEIGFYVFVGLLLYNAIALLYRPKN